MFSSHALWLHFGLALMALCLVSSTSAKSAQSACALSPQQHVVTHSAGEAQDRFGSALAVLEDSDGDGTREYAIGAPNAHAPSSAEVGALYVYSGASGGLLHTWLGVGPLERYGFAVTAAGDIDADGAPDVAIGAPQGEGSGRIDVRRMSNGELLWSLSGTASGDRFGHALAGLGDVNQDGCADVAIGAPHADAGSSKNVGRVEVRSGLDRALLWSASGAAFDQLGAALAALDDVDGDGARDVLVGIPFADQGGFNAGRAEIRSGRTGALVRAIDGATAGDRLGERGASVGDFDGDGLGDVGLGAPGADGGGFDSGAVEVRSSASGALLWRVNGEQAGEYLAVCCGLSDVDGDGKRELAVASGDGGAASGGVVRVYGSLGAQRLCVWNAPQAGQAFGHALVERDAGPFDTAPQFLVGAPGSDDVRDFAGYTCGLAAEPLSLATSTHELSISSGGTQQLALACGAAHGGAVYLVLGSAQSGAVWVDALLLPLLPDAYFWMTLKHKNQAPLHQTLGLLDSNGAAQAAFGLDFAAPAAAAGLVLFHAYVVLDPASGAVTFISNRAPLGLKG